MAAEKISSFLVLVPFMSLPQLSALIAFAITPLISLNLFARDTSVPEIQSRKSETKGELYLQFSLFMENNVHRTTNYRKGVLVPVNTPVHLLEQDDESIVVRLPDGAKLRLENIDAFSGESIQGIFRRTLRPQPVDLSVFSREEQLAIVNGTVEVGMSRAAVLLALGYPPKHKTPSLQGNQWRYWQNRFNTFLVIFDGDKVKTIKD